jgi:hypothetical protein
MTTTGIEGQPPIGALLVADGPRSPAGEPGRGRAHATGETTFEPSNVNVRIKISALWTSFVASAAGVLSRMIQQPVTDAKDYLTAAA